MTFTLARQITDLLRSCDERMNDPHGDGSGRDAMTPTAEHYNALYQLIGETVASYTPPPGDGAALRDLLKSVDGLAEAFAHAAWRLGVEDQVRAAISAAVQPLPSPDSALPEYDWFQSDTADVAATVYRVNRADPTDPYGEHIADFYGPQGAALAEAYATSLTKSCPTDPAS